MGGRHVSTYQPSWPSLIQSERQHKSATERLRRLLKDFMASGEHSGRGGRPSNPASSRSWAMRFMAMNAVLPIWEGLRLIKDEVTNADKGQIQVTAVCLHNFKVLRPAGFVRTKLKLS